MEFSDWLHHWLARHPVATPPVDRARYTAEVMARLAEAPALRARPARPSAVVVRWPRWPRLVYATSAAVAVLALCFGMRAYTQRRLVTAVRRTSEVLASLPAAEIEILDDGEDETAGQALELLDRLTLLPGAGASGGRLSAEHVLEVLEQLDELPSAEQSPEDASEDERWEELQQLDAEEIKSG